MPVVVMAVLLLLLLLSVRADLDSGQIASAARKIMYTGLTPSGPCPTCAKTRDQRPRGMVISLALPGVAVGGSK